MIRLTEFILVVLVNQAMAWWHSRLIRQNRPIRHGRWSLLYGALVALTIWLLPGLHALHSGALYALACAFGRLAVFAPALNLMRGLSLTYVSKTSTSIIDRLEARLFGTRAWLVEIGAGIVFIILQLFL